MIIPSGVEIANRFTEEHASRLGSFQGCDGLDMVRDGEHYCYVWLMAYVDLDMEAFYLLDVRTKSDTEETRDFLLLWQTGAAFGPSIAAEWQNKPIAFSAPVDAHRTRLRNGLAWMADRIEAAQEASDW